MRSRVPWADDELFAPRSAKGAFVVDLEDRGWVAGALGYRRFRELFEGEDRHFDRLVGADRTAEETLLRLLDERSALHKKAKEAPV